MSPSLKNLAIPPRRTLRTLGPIPPVYTRTRARTHIQSLMDEVSQVSAAPYLTFRQHKNTTAFSRISLASDVRQLIKASGKRHQAATASQCPEAANAFLSLVYAYRGSLRLLFSKAAIGPQAEPRAPGSDPIGHWYVRARGTPVNSSPPISDPWPGFCDAIPRGQIGELTCQSLTA